MYQATEEQIRLAQMIYDKNDAVFEDKVKQVLFLLVVCFVVWSVIDDAIYFIHSQLIEVTGKTQDECVVALHDCNEDVNRAINFLLESTSDTVRAHVTFVCCPST